MGRINLTRIYTRLGDGGSTHLGDMSRVRKTDPRIEAYGTVDELNGQLGVALAMASDISSEHRSWLLQIQNDLFDVGADLCVPAESREGRLTVTAGQTDWLEQCCDQVNATLAPLTSFVLPGGTPTASLLHVCRTVCRRAERRVLAVDDANPEILRYLNRLSDLLFVLSRAASKAEERLWRPGASAPSTDRPPADP